MDPHSFIARAEAQRWIGIAEKLLISHDLVGSKTFAIRARESDPRLEAADQILAIVDTLLSAEKRLVGSNGNQQPDYYAILQLVRFVQDTDHITSQYRRLAVILNPHHNRFPYSDQAFQLINDAWAVLSNPMRKSMYDSQLDFAHQQPQINNLGFNIEQQHQQHPHQHHNPNQHHHHQQQQQQQQHNFFSINQELAEPQQTFQTRLQPSHQQHQQLQQHNFLSQPNAAVREQQEQLFHHQDQQEQLFQPQVQPFQVTSTPHQQTRPSPQPPQPQPPAPIQSPPRPAVAATQSPFSWPQAPPLSQPQQQTQQHVQLEQQKQTQLQQQQERREQERQQQEQREQERQQQEQRQQHEQQQQEPLQQNAAPVQFPSQVDSNVNGVNEEETEAETEAEPEEVAEDVDDSPTFWTTCPYCFYMYEYPSVYADCTLRCDNCKRAFQAVRISSPPVIVDGQEAYFYSWGFIPIGVSMSHLQTKNNKGATSKWTPFSPLYDVSNNVQNHLNECAAPKENTFVDKSSGPRIYIDDYTDDVFIGVSEPSDDSDAEWDSTVKRKSMRMRIDLVQSFKERVQVLALRAIDPKNGDFKKLKLGIPVQEVKGVPNASVAEPIKKTVVNDLRQQSGVVAKKLGKLDLNVEFNNNEGEEPAPLMTRGHGHGEEDNIEGIGFFEGLDEFLSSLPILSVVDEEKVKAA